MAARLTPTRAKHRPVEVLTGGGKDMSHASLRLFVPGAADEQRGRQAERMTALQELSALRTVLRMGRGVRATAHARTPRMPRSLAAAAALAHAEGVMQGLAQCQMYASANQRRKEGVMLSAVNETPGTFGQTDADADHTG